MPRLYTVSFDNVTITNTGGDADLFELDAATDKPIELIEIVLGQSSELQEAQEEQIRISVIRGHATTGNGTVTTPRPLSPNDTAASFVAETYGTTIASAGTAVTMMSDVWPLRAGYVWGPRPQGMGIWTSGADLLVVRMLSTPADDFTGSGYITVVEYP